MRVKYFNDTDTAHVEFTGSSVFKGSRINKFLH